MNRNLIFCFIIVVLIFLASLVWIFPISSSIRAINSDYGFTNSGSIFDVSIGSNISNASRNLKLHSFDVYEVGKTGDCLSHGYPGKYRINVYSDDSWRKGTLCVIYDSAGIVRFIEWSYAALMVDL